MKGHKVQVQDGFLSSHVEGAAGNADEDGYSCLLALECRGLEPVEWHLGPGFKAEAESGKVFEDVDLTEGDWFGFDETTDSSVGIAKVEYKFVRI